jgi:N-carbamoyl-L-amino-acid hydrolase
VQPNRPLAVAVFPEEEGSRFGVACLGSRLLTGAIDPDRARTLTDADGVSFAEASRAAGIDPAGLGRDEETLARIGDFIELHVEQGRGLIDEDSAVAVGSFVLGHGRWRLSVHGQGNHAEPP